jgi:hypothetical protein
VFEYVGSDGLTHERVTRTHQPEKLEDDSQEHLLYDPNQPGQAVLFDNIPGKPQLDEMGQIKPSGRGWLAALVALGVLAGHGWYALHRFGSG